VETHPFEPGEAAPAEHRGTSDLTGGFYVQPGGIERPEGGSSPLYETGLLLKQLVAQKRNWMLIGPVLFLLLALFIGAGIAIGRALHRRGPVTSGATDPRRRPAPSDTEDGDQEDEEDSHATDAIENGLGFVPGDVSGDEYPDIEGVFVTRLTGDQSPASLGHMEAGDVLTQIGDTPVTDISDIAEALGSLEAGTEVVVKLYRDGETVATRIKIADPSHPPFGQKAAAPSDQGFLGLGNVDRRCCIPGTKKWGLEIDRLIDNSPADLAGLEEGDVITEFDKHPVRTPEELERRIRAATPRAKVMIKFYRGATEQTAEVLMGHGSADEESNKE
jgi:membrane-associated protease RseP (regulator of RpoE activity)